MNNNLLIYFTECRTATLQPSIRDFSIRCGEGFSTDKTSHPIADRLGDNFHPYDLDYVSNCFHTPSVLTELFFVRVLLLTVQHIVHDDNSVIALIAAETAFHFCKTSYHQVLID